MTALTAHRRSFEKTSERDISPEIVNNPTVTQQQSRQRIINETYPELSLNQMKKHKVQLRIKTPTLPATIEDASEDEESTTTSNCLTSAGILEGRSPHVLPPEELFRNNFVANQNFFTHPLISPKFKRRPLRTLRATKSTTAGLSRALIDPSIRNKRSISLLGERLSSANLDALPSDFSNLPTIPETVPMRKKSEKEESNSDDEENDVENTLEAFVSKCSVSSLPS
ncbi:unnamed protein product [Onchocerca flexuosa]|uniref:Uncharacterized protein n=1 Tax=Onchocerca flexuosa TaxID=387005 RepID=A0A183HKF1_9BILA|nr:unnamed protein product [Onchocerca flexuosa]